MVYKVSKVTNIWVMKLSETIHWKAMIAIWFQFSNHVTQFGPSACFVRYKASLNQHFGAEWHGEIGRISVIFGKWRLFRICYSSPHCKKSSNTGVKLPAWAKWLPTYIKVMMFETFSNRFIARKNVNMGNLDLLGALVTNMLIPTWINNNMPMKAWHEIIHPFPNSNDCTVQM